jgi:lysozyme family protein
MQTRFKSIIDTTLAHEGYISDDIHDSGGLTKYGISQRAYPNLDIRSLTKDEAVAIYYKDYYLANRCDKIEDDQVSGQYFDICVNSGGRNANFMIQKAVLAHGISLDVDGRMGPNTLNSINQVGSELASTLVATRICFYYRIVLRNPTQKRFINGWRNRAYSFGK